MGSKYKLFYVGCSKVFFSSLFLTSALALEQPITRCLLAILVGPALKFPRRDPKRLLERRDESGRTALFSAACAGHDGSVNALLDARANVDARNADGQTPLFCAARRNRTKTTAYLVTSGANVNAKGQVAFSSSSSSSSWLNWIAIAATKIVLLLVQHR